MTWMGLFVTLKMGPVYMSRAPSMSASGDGVNSTSLCAFTTFKVSQGILR